MRSDLFIAALFGVAGVIGSLPVTTLFSNSSKQLSTTVSYCLIALAIFCCFVAFYIAVIYGGEQMIQNKKMGALICMAMCVAGFIASARWFSAIDKSAEHPIATATPHNPSVKMRGFNIQGRGQGTAIGIGQNTGINVTGQSVDTQDMNIVGVDTGIETGNNSPVNATDTNIEAKKQGIKTGNDSPVTTKGVNINSKPKQSTQE